MVDLNRAPVTAACKDCKFGLKMKDIDIARKCVRNPPMIGDKDVGKWVTVHNDWWCGEFQPFDPNARIDWPTVLEWVKEK